MEFVTRVSVRAIGASSFVGVLLCFSSLGCGVETSTSEAVAAWKATIAKLEPLHEPLREPGPSDWLANHKESGQTFQQYLTSKPVRPTRGRRTIYIQPLGPFTEKQREIIDLSAEFLRLYYNLPVKIQKDLALAVIPDKARRKHPSWAVDQILTTFVLNDVLRPRLPDDAAAYIAFTATDLWPGKGWNFVYGQASLQHRVGVWSINRNGDPEAGENEFRLCLRRTLKTAAHETGHMFSIKHCIAHECNMCGRNNRAESDRSPLYLCPQCVAKVCWATNTDIVERYQKLAKFCKDQRLDDEEEFYKKSIYLLAVSR